MELTSLYKLLSSLGYPVAYNQFESEPTVPFIAYITDGTENLCADNKVYNKENNYMVEVYNDKKDIHLENRIETLFNENDVCWKKDEIYIKEEKLYEIIYYI